MLGHCKIPFSSLREEKTNSTSFSTPEAYPWPRGREMDSHCQEQGEQMRREASAPNKKPGCSKSCKSTGLWRGWVRWLQVPLARGGVPTLPAARDLPQGAAATWEMCSAKKPGKH